MLILIIRVATALIASTFFHVVILSRKSVVEELYSVKLSRRRTAFVHFGYSSVILRTGNFMTGITTY